MTERFKTPDYVLLDLDRTLLNTEAAMADYVALIRQHDANLSNRLYWAWRQAEDSNESFDARRFLIEEVVMERVPQSTVDQFDKLFSIPDQVDYSYLNDGAGELLQALDERQVPHGVLTYGSVEWQTLKLQASGLDALPHIVTQQRAKGRVLTSWMQPSGEIKLPKKLTDRYKALGGGTLSSVVLVDDKLEALVGLPDGVTGYWYTDKVATKSARITTVVGDVELGIVTDLRQILGII